jgi:hypothetical protein|tara:strand:+ start:950 stop:1774 length:825 start_codon:yes stop_codon:yes gene_type:complete
MKRKNYLNNKDLLKEIHKSKVSYCSYISEGDDQFDIILPNISRINIRTVAEAKRNQASRLAKQAYEEAVNAGQKVKQAEFEVNWKKIKKQELIFRIMTFDHIPLQPGRKKNPKTVADHHTQCNFPPFQHFKFNEEDKLICIGKSHWDGGMENGAFSKIHGKMTNELAKMYMKLCERYATRSNWRGYTYNDEMRGNALLQLSQIGLQFDESKSQNPFAYYTAAITNSFTRVLNIEKKNQNIRDDILEHNGLNPSYTRQSANEANKSADPKLVKSK